MSAMSPSQQESESDQRGLRRFLSTNILYTAPWWLIILIMIGIAIVILIRSDEIYSGIFEQLREGVGMTLGVSLIAYLSALVIGLIIGLIRSTTPSPPKPGTGIGGALTAIVRTILYNVASLYVNILRGLPILVTLLIVAFVLVPMIRNFLEGTFSVDIDLRGTSPESAIIALAFTYGAFLSETFRAGIQSISRGQIEAARSLGMNYYQTVIHVVLPQALRRILPPLGNDMIAMIKDSSLVAILGVRDITQIAKTSSGRSFRYLETYLVVAVIYLTMTVLGTLIVRYIERRVKIDH
ncbi:MAG: amino acid ABC transporter permease [Anaerolineae bacterium]|nr:amino acid ABC transporter permease [Anaerolineae bacterium]